MLRTLLGSIGIACAFTASGAWAASSSVNPNADAFVSANEPNSNFGGAGALETSAASSANGLDESLMRFDLSTVATGFNSTFGAGNWQVQSVTLTLTTASPANQIFNANVAGNLAATWVSNDNWTEGTGTPMAPTTDGVTYSTLPTSGSDESLGSLAFNGSLGAQTYTLGLPSGFVADVTGGNLVSVLLAPGDSTVSDLVNSRSFGTATARPSLTVTATAVPEPAAVVVVLLAGIGLRRHRSGSTR